MNAPSTSEGDLRQPTRRFSAPRRALGRTVEAAAVAMGGRRFYRRRHLARGRFLVREEALAIPGLPPGLRGFTTVQWSDLHAGPFLAAGDLADVVDVTNELEPDLVAVTGDMITHRWTDAALVAGDIGRLRAVHGVLGVFGNHDYKGRREQDIAAALGRHGLRFLRNETARIDTGAGALAVVGLEDLEESRELDLEAARAGVEPGDIELVLCHNPLSARALARDGCAAVLSGHSHGTQVDLPLLRASGPAHPGARLRLGPTTLIVSRGLGVVVVPFRVGAPSEIVVVRFEEAA